jgi:hypothetical protein
MNRSQSGTQSTTSRAGNHSGEGLTKRAYMPPTLVVLGTISDLTRGVGGNSVDSGGLGPQKISGS